MTFSLLRFPESHSQKPRLRLAARSQGNQPTLPDFRHNFPRLGPVDFGIGFCYCNRPMSEQNPRRLDPVFPTDQRCVIMPELMGMPVGYSGPLARSGNCAPV